MIKTEPGRELIERYNLQLLLVTDCQTLYLKREVKLCVKDFV